MKKKLKRKNPEVYSITHIKTNIILAKDIRDRINSITNIDLKIKASDRKNCIEFYIDYYVPFNTQKAIEQIITGLTNWINP